MERDRYIIDLYMQKGTHMNGNPVYKTIQSCPEVLSDQQRIIFQDIDNDIADIFGCHHNIAACRIGDKAATRLIRADQRFRNNKKHGGAGKYARLQKLCQLIFSSDTKEQYPWHKHEHARTDTDLHQKSESYTQSDTDKQIPLWGIFQQISELQAVQLYKLQNQINKYGKPERCRQVILRRDTLCDRQWHCQKGKYTKDRKLSSGAQKPHTAVKENGGQQHCQILEQVQKHITFCQQHRKQHIIFT